MHPLLRRWLSRCLLLLAPLAWQSPALALVLHGEFTGVAQVRQYNWELERYEDFADVATVGRFGIDTAHFDDIYADSGMYLPLSDDAGFLDLSIGDERFSLPGLALMVSMSQWGEDEGFSLGFGGWYGANVNFVGDFFPGRGVVDEETWVPRPVDFDSFRLAPVDLSRAYGNARSASPHGPTAYFADFRITQMSLQTPAVTPVPEAPVWLALLVGLGAVLGRRAAASRTARLAA